MRKAWSIILLTLCISGCSGEKCIDADDFGFANLVVSSRYDKEDLKQQVGGQQVGPWNDSNYRVNGRPLTILVRSWSNGEDGNWSWDLSAWCAWYGSPDNANTLSELCKRLQDCRFERDEMCTKTKDAKIVNAPCLFRNGVGLYALISSKINDPNLSFVSMRAPDGLTFHLGEKTDGYEMLDISKNGKMRKAGGMVYKYEEPAQDQATLKRIYADSKLYFKILDKFYDDNNGQYKISIKSGITDTTPDPIQYITNLVKNYLFGTGGDDYGLIRNLYLGIVNNPGYRFAVSAVLTLYIMFTGLEYLTGNINVSHTELIVRVGKIAIVSALLSAKYSWSFFNDYLFVYFVGGVEQVLQIIMEAGASGPGSPSILGLMIAPQTLSKLFSVLFVDPLGFIYIILFFIALYFILLIFLQAAVIYLSALIAIGLIITMGPIFICFLLFGVTKSLFENWLKQLISYAVQPIILFVGLIFISMILRNEIYAALGFRVCKFGFPNLTSSRNSQISYDALAIMSGGTQTGAKFMDNSLFHWWFPHPMKGENFTRTTSVIPIPIDHFDENGDLCEAYGCNGARYPDLPFLDPVKDKRRLNNFWNGRFVQLDGLLLIFVAIYLLHKFNGLAVSVAKFITGTSGNLTNIKKIGDTATSDFQSRLGQIGSAIKDKAANTGSGRAIGAKRAEISGRIDEVKNGPSKMADQARIAGLKKDALSSNANSATLKEVKRNTGLDQKDLKAGAIGDYKNEIAGRLKAGGLKLNDEESKKLASKLSKGSHDQMDKTLAQAHYGKSYDQLDNKQKEIIKETLKDKNNGKSMHELSKDAMAARRFQQAYVGAHSAQEQGLKSDLYGKSTGNKGERSGFSSGMFGGSYNQIDQNNTRKQTYGETLEDQRRQLESNKVKRQLEQLNNRHGDNVISPEYLAKQPHGTKETQNLEKLAREDIKHLVYKGMTDGKDPALPGEKYMKEFAKDSELRHNVDRAYEVKKDLMQKDEFINREQHYESVLSSATKNINDKHDLLKNHYGRKNIKAEEMPSLMHDYYAKQGPGKQGEGMAEIAKFKKNLEEFDKSQAILQKIDERKQMVSEEVNNHVSTINEHRKSAGMDEYRLEEKPSNIRRVRKIEDHLGNN